MFELAPPPFNQLEPVRHGPARVWSLSTGPLNQNCLLAADQDGAALLFDPGAEPAQILRMVESSGAEVQAILLTHAHPDHIGAVQPVREALGVPVYLHPLEQPNYQQAPAVAQALGLPSFVVPALPDREISQGQTFSVGAVELTARELPGHAPGHVVFVGPGFAVVGDTLFAGAIAPTNVPGADREQLISGIVRELLSLPPETVIYPGHGAPTTVATERERPLFRRYLREAKQ